MDKSGQKSKQSNVLSISLKRLHTVYECALDSEWMGNILVMHYNMWIKQGYFPKR